MDSRYDTSALGRPLLAILCYNNGVHATETLLRVPQPAPFDVVVHDDGSTDDTATRISAFPFPVLHRASNAGLGASFKAVIRYARDGGYRVLAVMAGNGKDDPRETERLLEPLYRDGYDYVQGSRRLHRGMDGTPWPRRLVVPLHAVFASVVTGVRQTDALNGHRAYRLAPLFEDPAFQVWGDWLDGYSFEAYLHYRFARSRYRTCEVPVTKSYAGFAPAERYSHIRMLRDGWSIVRPWVLLPLRLRR